MNTAYFVKEITVNDPESNNPVEISVFKHSNGGMFAIDSSFITQVLKGSSISDPLNENETVYLKGID